MGGVRKPFKGLGAVEKVVLSAAGSRLSRSVGLGTWKKRRGKEGTMNFKDLGSVGERAWSTWFAGSRQRGGNSRRRKKRAAVEGENEGSGDSLPSVGSPAVYKTVPFKEKEKGPEPLLERKAKVGGINDQHHVLIA